MLTWLPRPVPETDLDAYLVARRSLNDAPRGPLETEDRRESPTSVRAFEALLARVGVELWTLAASTTVPSSASATCTGPRATRTSSTRGTRGSTHVEYKASLEVLLDRV